MQRLLQTNSQLSTKYVNIFNSCSTNTVVTYPEETLAHYRQQAQVCISQNGKTCSVNVWPSARMASSIHHFKCSKRSPL